MSKRFLKVSLLGLLLVMCMSVAMAADVSEDTTSEVATPQSTDTNNVDTTDYVSTEDNDNEINKQVNPTRSYNPITVNTCINDSTWDNQSYDVYSNVKITTNISQSNNIAFNLNGNNITIDGLNIVNDETQPICINIASGSSDIKIINNNIAINNNASTETRAVYMFNATNVCVTNNTFDICAVPQSSGWDNSTGVWLENMKVSAVKEELSNKVTINNNVITVSNSVSSGDYFSSTDAITVKKSENSLIDNNTITMSGSAYLYAISASYYCNNITAINNIINLTGNNYICGIQFSSTSNSKARNNQIIGTCTATSGACPSYEAFAYGIISLTGTWGASTSEAVGNIICNNDVTLNSTIAYAYELSNAENNIICNNTATITGNVVMALGIYNSSYNNICYNTFTVTGNTITLNDSIYEAVYPVTTGIKIVDDGFNNTQNNTIIGNTINVTDTNSASLNDIILEGTNNTIITENYMTLIPRVGFRIKETGCSNTSITNNYGLP